MAKARLGQRDREEEELPAETHVAALAINERAHILGLQLQQQALADKVAEAIRCHGTPKLQQQLQQLIDLGVVEEEIARTRAALEQLSQLEERVRSGQAASTSHSLSSASGSRPGGLTNGAHAGPGGSSSSGRHQGRSTSFLQQHRKQFSAVAQEHLRAWREELQDALDMLTALTTPGGLEFWTDPDRDDPAPQVRTHGPPVAHFLDRIPPELACHIALPPVSYPPQHPPAGASAGAGATSGSPPGPLVHWDAAPLLRDPTTGVAYRVARHESAALAWPTLRDGDLLLLLPGRYEWREGSWVLHAGVRVLGLGRRAHEVVIHNQEEDDFFVECRAEGGPGCVLENLTLLQLGGYEGAVRVFCGRATLVDVTLQCSTSGPLVDPGATLVMRNCVVVGGVMAALQVDAGARLELHSCEVSRGGNGDENVPKDLGGIEVHCVLSEHPCAPPHRPAHLLEAHRHRLLPPAAGQQPPQVAARQQASCSAGKQQASCSSSGRGAALAESGATHGPGPPRLMQLEEVQDWLGRLQRPATVLVGPGCTIQSNRGFALSVVKRRALAALHDAMHSGGGGGAGGGSSGAGPSASSGGSSTSSLGSACEGARVLVCRGVSLGGNTRGPLGVVEREYHEKDGDAVNRRTAARHFHAVQLGARQLQEGFALPVQGCDWTAERIAMEARPARPGRRATKVEVAAAAAAAVAVAAVGVAGGGGNGVVVGSRSLRVLLSNSVCKATRRQQQRGRHGSSSSSSGSSSEDDGEESDSTPVSDSGSGASCSSGTGGASWQAASRVHVDPGGQVEPSQAAPAAGAPEGGLPMPHQPPAPNGNHAAQAGEGAPTPPGNGTLQHSSAAASAIAGSAGRRPRACFACGSTSAQAKLHRCAGCLCVLYCSEDCQRTDWPHHSAQCKALRRAMV